MYVSRLLKEEFSNSFMFFLFSLGKTNLKLISENFGFS